MCLKQVDILLTSKIKIEMKKIKKTETKTNKEKIIKNILATEKKKIKGNNFL